MSRSKAKRRRKSDQEQQHQDFTKKKQRLGKKLKAANETDTTISKRQIYIRSSQKPDSATQTTGHSLTDLISRTTHHNATTRKDCLNAIHNSINNESSTSYLSIKSNPKTVILTALSCISDDVSSVRQSASSLLLDMLNKFWIDDIDFIMMLKYKLISTLTHLKNEIRVFGCYVVGEICKKFDIINSGFAEVVICVADVLNVARNCKQKIQVVDAIRLCIEYHGKKDVDGDGDGDGDDGDGGEIYFYHRVQKIKEGKSKFSNVDKRNILRNVCIVLADSLPSTNTNINNNNINNTQDMNNNVNWNIDVLKTASNTLRATLQCFYSNSCNNEHGGEGGEGGGEEEEEEDKVPKFVMNVLNDCVDNVNIKNNVTLNNLAEASLNVGNHILCAKFILKCDKNDIGIIQCEKLLNNCGMKEEKELIEICERIYDNCNYVIERRYVDEIEKRRKLIVSTIKYLTCHNHQLGWKMTKMIFDTQFLKICYGSGLLNNMICCQVDIFQYISNNSRLKHYVHSILSFLNCSKEICNDLSLDMLKRLGSVMLMNMTDDNGLCHVHDMIQLIIQLEGCRRKVFLDVMEWIVICDCFNMKKKELVSIVAMCCIIVKECDDNNDENLDQTNRIKKEGEKLLHKCTYKNV